MSDQLDDTDTARLLPRDWLDRHEGRLTGSADRAKRGAVPRRLSELRERITPPTADRTTPTDRGGSVDRGGSADRTAPRRRNGLVDRAATVDRAASAWRSGSVAREARPRLGYGASDRILVVGAGAAGLAAAGELRRLGFAGHVTVLGGEPEQPYDRPACSKGLLNGHQKPADTRLPVPGGVQVRTGRRAAELDLAARVVTTETGETYAFDGLVLAPGDHSALNADWAREAPGLRPLHGLRDALAVRRELRGAERVAIVGGGLTGCETACAVREMAREAVIIDSKRCLMHRAIGEPMGRLVTWVHRHAGIDLRLGRRVAGAESRRGRWRLSLDDGTAVYADLVVLTTGERPDVAWLEGSGLDVSDGVRCDETLRALDIDGQPVPGVVAAGSAASWPNPWNAGEQTRCGQWIAALEQGREAARTLLAGAETTAPVAVLPRFWSQQSELRIEVCGRLDPNAEVSLTELHPSRRHHVRSGVLASYQVGGRLVGVAAVNAPHAFTAAARALLANPPVAEQAPTPVAAPAPGVRGGAAAQGSGSPSFVPEPIYSAAAPRLAIVRR